MRLFSGETGEGNQAYARIRLKFYSIEKEEILNCITEGFLFLYRNAGYFICLYNRQNDSHMRNSKEHKFLINSHKRIINGRQRNTLYAGTGSRDF